MIIKEIILDNNLTVSGICRNGRWFVEIENTKAVNELPSGRTG